MLKEDNRNKDDQEERTRKKCKEEYIKGKFVT